MAHKMRNLPREQRIHLENIDIDSRRNVCSRAGNLVSAASHSYWARQRPNIITVHHPRQAELGTLSQQPHMVIGARQRPNIITVHHPRQAELGTLSQQPHMVIGARQRPDIITVHHPRQAELGTLSQQPHMVIGARQRPDYCSPPSTSRAGNLVSAASHGYWSQAKT